MKRFFLQVLIIVILILTAAGCGPSQAELNTPATQLAAEILATPTAQAPTATATFIPTTTATLIPTTTPTLTRTPTPTPTPTPFGGGSKIAFSSNRDGNYEIYIMDSDGSHQKRLTNSPNTEDWFPELLLDGEGILYWSYSAGDPPIANLNWIWLVNDEQGVYITTVGPYSSVSKEGLVAITLGHEDGSTDIGGAHISGKGDIVLLTDHQADDTNPTWSPDGRTIAFVSYRDGPPHIYLMDWDGNNQRRLMDSDLNELEPSWSPDGSTIAFLVVDETDTSNIYLVNADGTDMRPFTSEEGTYNENPVWSPDGTMIAFWSNRTGNHEIYALKLDGSELVNLTNNPSEDENPSWSK